MWYFGRHDYFLYSSYKIELTYINQEKKIPSPPKEKNVFKNILKFNERN